MIIPERAPVRPRVKRKGGDVSFLLEEEIAELAAAGERGVVVLTGKSGSGKTTALRHLAAVLKPDMAVQLLDPSGDQRDVAHEMAVESLANHALIVSTAPLVTRGADVDFELVPWSQDEWIEYLLAAHRDQCKSVMGRLLADDANDSAQFTAENWRVVLDEMAADENIASPLDAMVCRLSKRFTRDEQLALSPLALDEMRIAQMVPWPEARKIVPEIDRPSWRLLNQP